MSIRRFDYEHVNSTQRVARELANQQPDEPILVTAITQSVGRGRFDRLWQSPRGGAWISLVWPMGDDALTYDDAPQRAAMAVYRTVLAVVGEGERVALKQPNDVLVDGKKVAGVLCERTLQAGTVPGVEVVSGAHLIVGVGINADFEDSELNGSDLRYPATTLRTVMGHSIDTGSLIDTLVRELEAGLVA